MHWKPAIGMMVKVLGNRVIDYDEDCLSVNEVMGQVGVILSIMDDALCCVQFEEKSLWVYLEEISPIYLQVDWVKEGF